MCQSVSQFVAHVHRTVNDVSQVYLTNERRYNYTTPKSFLEQIKLYQVSDTTLTVTAHRLLSNAMRSNDDIGWPVHSLILLFHDLRDL